MRARTVMALATGATVGAGTMYLLDPVHGATRRRAARRSAVRRTRAGAVGLALDTRQRAEEVARAALDGYQRGRRGESVVIEPPRSVWRRLAG